MKHLVLFLIQKYQKYISPILCSMGIRCKYYPSCSEYTKQAIEKYGIVRGIGKGGIRIFKCNPFSKGGYDPLK